jgi:hypothetical protein
MPQHANKRGTNAHENSKLARAVAACVQVSLQFIHADQDTVKKNDVKRKLTVAMLVTTGYKWITKRKLEIDR